MGKNDFKLNAGIRFIIYYGLKQGQTIKDICEIVGVSTSTYYSWLNDGKKLLERKEDMKELKYKDFEKIKLFKMVNKIKK